MTTFKILSLASPEPLTPELSYESFWRRVNCLDNALADCPRLYALRPFWSPRTLVPRFVRDREETLAWLTGQRLREAPQAVVAAYSGDSRGLLFRQLDGGFGFGHGSRNERVLRTNWERSVVFELFEDLGDQFGGVTIFLPPSCTDDLNGLIKEAQKRVLAA